ncbi:MAG: hypothetical protein AABX97_07435 [Candidatus Thermoplasmatota archaeon]
MESATTKGSGLGILKSFRARHAEEAIVHSEGLVTVLRLSQADMKAAEDALGVAKQLFNAHQFSKALNAARKAESIAITLEERFSGYQKAVKALRIRIDDLRRLGLHTEDLEAVLGRAEENVLAGAWENSSFVPNYLEAKALLDQAAEEGRTLLMNANAASNRIFLAELAIEALADTQGPKNPKVFAEGATLGLERSLEDATRELALGHVDAATRIAMDIEARAEKLRADYADTNQILARTETQLAELRGEGIVTERIERQVAFARDMLARGMIEPALPMAKRLNDDSLALGDTHNRAATGLADAEVLYSRMVREGFHSYEAEAAIKEARRAVREGSYARALEQLDRAHAAFARRRNARETLVKALEETRKRVEILSNAEFPFLPDVQEVLGRAEREFRQGNYSGSSEDLQIATVLLTQTSKAPPRKP